MVEALGSPESCKAGARLAAPSPALRWAGPCNCKDERRGPLLAAMSARAAAPVMQRDLAPIIGHLRPDVVLRETGELAADVDGPLFLHPFPVSFGQRPDSPIARPIRPDRGSPSANDSLRARQEVSGRRRRSPAALPPERLVSVRLLHAAFRYLASAMQKTP